MYAVAFLTAGKPGEPALVDELQPFKRFDVTRVIKRRGLFELYCMVSFKKLGYELRAEVVIAPFERDTEETAERTEIIVAVLFLVFVHLVKLNANIFVCLFGDFKTENGTGRVGT